MFQLIHEILTAYTAPGLILTFGLCFLYITIPHGVSLAAYRMARKMMGCSYLVFFVALLCEAVSLSLDTSSELQQIIMISIGILQAFLFTYALTTLIDVNFFNWRRFIREAMVVMVPILVAFVVFSFGSDRLGFIIFLILALFYLYKLVDYVVRFMRRYRDYEHRMSNYFSDDERQRLQWVKRFFFEALGIGILALLYSFFPMLITSLVFTIIMGVYYTLFGIRFINYAFTFQQIEAAMTEEATEAVEKTTDGSVAITAASDMAKTMSTADSQLMDRLDSLMVEKNLYNKPYLTVEDLAVQAGVPYRLVSATINKCKGMTFKSWINSYRVEEAIRLIEDGYLKHHTVEALAQTVGFTNRTNFYRVFKGVTGHLPTDY